MGESVAEATLTSWLKDVGDSIDMDEAVVEIATDKVDSEVPSEHKGVLIEKCFKINEVIKVGETIAIIETDSEIKTAETIIEIDQKNDSNTENKKLENKNIPQDNVPSKEDDTSLKEDDTSLKDSSNNRFYSPLVKNIIKKGSYSCKKNIGWKRTTTL